MTNVHLIDSHRPWNLDNLFATNEIMDRLWVWDDGEIIAKMQREREAYETLEFDIDSDEEDEEEEESDAESSGSELSGSDEEDSDVSRQKRRRLRSGSQRGVGVGGEDDEEEEDGSSSLEGGSPRQNRRQRRRRKRLSKSPSTKVSREQKDLYRAVLARYYNRGTGLGMSVSGMIFILAEVLGRAENEGLWLAILGLSAQYLSNSIPYDLYDSHAASIASDVIALNPPVAPSTGVSSAQSNGHVPKPVSADDGRIRVIDDELRFTLYRHWSLESAMYHTSYVAGKLGVWREKGLTKIRGLLAKMGFSLVHSRQHYNNMPLDLRNSLTDRLEAIAPEYGLTDLIFKSFVRSFGFRSGPLSAMDTVEALNALLIAATGLRVEVQDESLTFSGAAPGGIDRGAYRGQGTPITSELFGAKRIWNLGGGGAGADGKENRAPAGIHNDDVEEDAETAAAIQHQSQSWVRNFFIAYEALDCKKSASLAMINSSLSLARSLHSAVLDVGTSLIDKQSIRSLKSFRLAILRDGPHLDLFSTQPAMLTRLGQWLTDALRDIVNEQERRKQEAKKASRKSRGKDVDGSAEDDLHLRSLPFVVCALNPTREVYLVVGLIGSPDFGDVQRNRFGLAFQDAIRQSGARSRTEGWFDTTAVEIRKEDLAGFVEQLHLKA